MSLAPTEEIAMDTLPRVKAVAAARAPWTLNIVWADGAKDRVDGLDYGADTLRRRGETSAPIAPFPPSPRKRGEGARARSIHLF